MCCETLRYYVFYYNLSVAISRLGQAKTARCAQYRRSERTCVRAFVLLGALQILCNTCHRQWGKRGTQLPLETDIHNP
jgi:hypothetical protein